MERRELSAGAGTRGVWRSVLFVAAVSCWGVCASAAPAYSPDPGGYSVQFTPAAEEASPAAGVNPVKNAGFEEALLTKGGIGDWLCGFHVYASKQDEKQGRALTAVAAPLSVHEASTDNPHSGARCMHLCNPSEINDRQGEVRLHFSSYCSQSLEFPPLEADKKFAFTVYTRGQIVPEVPGSRARIYIAFYDAVGLGNVPKKATRSAVLAHASVQKDWQRAAVDFLVPKQTRMVAVSLYLDGCGDIYYDDATLHEMTMDSGVTVRLIPQSFMDNLYCLSSGDPGILLLGFRNESGAQVKKPQVTVELPAAVQVLDVRSGAKVVERAPFKQGGEDGIRYTIDPGGLARMIDKQDYNMRNALGLVLSTSLPAGETRYQGRYWLTDGDYKAQPKSFALKVLPPTRGDRPQWFHTAAIFSTETASYSNPAAIRALADAYHRAGFNAAHRPLGLSQAMRERNIYRYSEDSHLVNGYRIGGGGKPDSVAFTFADGTHHSDAICPTEVYRKGAWFQKQVVEGMLRKWIVTDRDTESIMPNWEPYMYNYKGCFCDRCKEEFIRYSKRPREELEKAWPANIVRDFRDIWITFRSWQHAQVILTLEAETSRLGKEIGIDSHFAPEVACDLVMASHQNEEHGTQYRVTDYMDQLPVLSVWGAYCNHNLLNAAPARPGYHLRCLGMAQPVREFVDNRLPQGKRPRLLGLAHSYQGDTWGGLPEGIAHDFLTLFVNRWQGAFAYVFPRGYDARYWQALAQANTAIARYEDVVLGGECLPAPAMEPLTPLPMPDPSIVVELENKKDLLRARAYRKDDRLLFAVGNFWDSGECFFHLKPAGIDANKTYVLWEPVEGRCYANKAGKIALSAADLNAGLLLHVGAIRYSFFMLEPYVQGKTYGTTVVQPQEMQSSIEQRLPAIKRACEADMKRVADVPKEEIEDYSQLKTIANGNLTCKPVSLDGRGTGIAIDSPMYRMVLDPAGGARIVSWKVKDDELVHAEGKFGLALDAFWWPRSAAGHISSPFTVVSEEPTREGLKLVFRRKTGKEARSLEGVTLTKTFDIASGKLAAMVSTEIENTAEHQVEFSHRYHNMPAALETRPKQEGWADLSADCKPIRFTRQFIEQIFTYAQAPADEDLTKTFRMDKRRVIDEPWIVLGANWLKSRLRLDMDKDTLADVVFWDCGGQPCATLEQIHRRVALKPGETWTTHATWTIEGQ